MTDPTPSPPPDDLPLPVKPRYHLPRVTNLEEVNTNFETISDLFVIVGRNMEEHSETTNQNFIRLAEETTENLNKLNTDIRSIISSQTMMFSICIIMGCMVISVLKGIFEIVGSMFAG